MIFCCSVVVCPCFFVVCPCFLWFVRGFLWFVRVFFLWFVRGFFLWSGQTAKRPVWCMKEPSHVLALLAAIFLAGAVTCPRVSHLQTPHLPSFFSPRETWIRSSHLLIHRLLTTAHQPLMAVVPHHFLHGRHGSICASRDPVQERQSERASRRAPQHRTPSAHQSSVGPPLQDLWQTPNTRCGEASSRNGLSLWKTDRPLLEQERRVGRSLLRPPTQGNAALCASCLVSKLRRSSLHFVALLCLHHGHTRVVSTANWAPRNKGKPSTTPSSLRWSMLSNMARSRSRTSTLVLTRPPASRQTRAAAFSSGNPRRPNTPATGHPDRWWPRLSRRRPHQQERTVRGRGRRRRRRNNNLKTCDFMRETLWYGMLMDGAEASGPPCDRRSAFWWSGRPSWKPSKHRSSTSFAAFDCHPSLGWDVLGSSCHFLSVLDPQSPVEEINSILQLSAGHCATLSGRYNNILSIHVPGCPTCKNFAMANQKAPRKTPRMQPGTVFMT